MFNKSKYFKVIQIIISLLFIYYLFNQLNLEEVLSNIKEINIFYMSISFLLFIPWIILSNIKWNSLLNFYKIKIDKPLSIYWIWSFFNNFLPSSFWWDWYRFFYVNKKFKEKKKENLSAILFERITWIFIIALINIIWFIWFFNILKTEKITFLISIWIFSLSLFIILISIFWQHFYKLIPIKFVREKIKKISFLLKAIPRKILLINLLLSLLFYILIFIAYLFYFKAVWIDLNNINFLLLFYLITIINLFWLFPISLNWIWVSESLQVFLFSFLLWISPELILLTALIWRFWWISMSSIWWIIYLKEKISK